MMKRILDVVAFAILGTYVVGFLILIGFSPRILVHLAVAGAGVWAFWRVLDYFDEGGLGL